MQEVWIKAPRIHSKSVKCCAARRKSFLVRDVCLSPAFNFLQSDLDLQIRSQGRPLDPCFPPKSLKSSSHPPKTIPGYNYNKSYETIIEFITDYRISMANSKIVISPLKCVGGELWWRAVLSLLPIVFLSITVFVSHGIKSFTCSGLII